MASENVAELLHRNTRLRSQVLHRIAEIDAQLQHIDCLLKAVGDQPSTHIKYVLRSSPPSPSPSSSPPCSITTSASLMAVASAGRVNRRIADPFRDAGLCAGVGHHILQREPIPLSRAAMDMKAREAVFPAMANTNVAGKGHSHTYRGVVRESKRQREPVTKKKLLQRFVAAMSFPKCVGHWADPFSHTVVALCFMLESMLLPCVRHEERVGRLREVFLLPRVQRLQESVVEPRMLAHVVQCKDADLLKNTRVEQLRRMQWRPREEIQDEVVMEVFYALIIASGCGAGPAYNKGEVRLLFGP